MTAVPPIGIYIAVPFCRSKCSFCNFASQVFPAAVYREYCDLLAREIELAAAQENFAGVPVDTLYWGGGTPTLLPSEGVRRIMDALRRNLDLLPGAEHTMEAAPGTLAPAVIETLATAGVNRISLGVQSFVDQEARAVGRLHRRATVLDDVARLRAAGLNNLSLDLIAGLPHQTVPAWQESLTTALATGVPHFSVYMLEVDEGSRLGNELLAGGTRYHAHAVPDEDFAADAYDAACARFETNGRPQYEISNFAASGRESQHNLRYWRRRPYRGFGVDAHSHCRDREGQETRFANPDTLEAYLMPLRAWRLPRLDSGRLTALQCLEEMLFLGLRCRPGIELAGLELAATGSVSGYSEWLRPRWERWVNEGLAEAAAGRIALTARGRLLSNRVFADCLGFPGA